MCYIYILKSKKDNNYYIGSTIDLQKRISEHSRGLVRSTKHRRPLVLIGCRKLDSIKKAALWERKYKRSHGQLERDIKNKKIKFLRA